MGCDVGESFLETLINELLEECSGGAFFEFEKFWIRLLFYAPRCFFALQDLFKLYCVVLFLKRDIKRSYRKWKAKDLVLFYSVRQELLN